MILKYFISVFYDLATLFSTISYFFPFKKQGVIFGHFLWISDDDGGDLMPDTTTYFGLGWPVSSNQQSVTSLTLSIWVNL